MTQKKPSLTEVMTSAAKIEQHMKNTQQELNKIIVSGSSGGDMITVKMSGRHDVLSVHIDDSLIQPDKKAVLETLLAAAVNDAVLNIELATKEKIMSLAESIHLSEAAITDTTNLENE